MTTGTGHSRADTLLWILAIGLLAAIVVVAGIKLRPLLEPRIQGLAPLPTDCDLHAAPCTVAFPGRGEVRFAIEPRGIPLAKPLILEVQVRGIAPSAVEVDFAGVDMNMGFNRVALAPTGAPATADGVEPDGDLRRFRGTGMLPVCTIAAMTWEARVLLHTPDGVLAAPFRFETRR